MVTSLRPTRVTQAGTQFLTGQQLGRQQGLQDQERQTLQTAGQLASSGDLTGARDAFFKSGQFDRGLATQQAITKMSNERLAQAKFVQDQFARIAPTIETPEQFEIAKERFKAQGLPVGNLTFDQLPQLRQQALSVQEQMAFEMQRRGLDLKKAQARAKAAGPTLSIEEEERLKTRGRERGKLEIAAQQSAEEGEKILSLTGQIEELIGAAGSNDREAFDNAVSGLFPEARNSIIQLLSDEAEGPRTFRKLQQNLGTIRLLATRAFLSGQGQITEGERAIVDDAIGQLQSAEDGASALDALENLKQIVSSTFLRKAAREELGTDIGDADLEAPSPSSTSSAPTRSRIVDDSAVLDLPDGTRVRDRATGDEFVVRGGRLIPIDDASPAARGESPAAGTAR